MCCKIGFHIQNGDTSAIRKKKLMKAQWQYRNNNYDRGIIVQIVHVKFFV